MKIKLLRILFLFLLFSGGTLAAQEVTESEDRDFYSEGIESLNKGDINGALTVWIEAYKKIDDSSKIDPRIGSAFIEIVAEYNLKTLYEISTLIFYWSLDSRAGGQFSDYLKEEIDKSGPIFDPWDFKKYQKKAKSDPFEVAGIVKQYWISLDPTPSTRVNERLLEHWDRVVFSKENFTKTDDTVFGTDHRALTYVRYGKPDIRYAGKLRYDTGSIFSSVSTVLDVSEKEVKKLIEECFNNYYAPEYEIWIYAFLSEEGRIVNMFGEKSSTRSFQAIESVNEFIPNNAFGELRSVRKGTAVYTPGYFLLHSYMKQLVTFDSHFEEQFTELNQILMYPTEGITGKQVLTTSSWIFPKARSYTSSMNQIIAKAPIEQSDYLKNLDELEVKVKQYEFYDEENNLSLFSVMNSYPLKNMLNYMAQDERDNLDNYSLKHNLSIASLVDNGFEILDNEPPLPFLTKKQAHPAQTIFKVKAPDKNIRLTFSAQISDDLADTRATKDVLPASLKATGKVQLEDVKSTRRKEDFHLSDVMIGYQVGEPNWDNEISFLVSLDNKIPSFSNLFLHFQAINLDEGDSGDGKTQLRIELSVKERKGVLGIFSRNKTNSVSFTYNENTDQIRESLEFELTDRKPGNYELIVKAIDVNSGKSKTRKVDFEIINIE